MSIFKPLCLALLSAAALFAASCGGDEPKTIQYNLSAVQPGEDFTDPRDNNVYHTVRVGDQLWMAENLRYAPNGYSLDGAYSWNERPVDLTKIVPDNAAVTELIDRLFHDPKYNGWEVDGTPIAPWVEGFIQQLKRGRMTVAEVRENIKYLNPAFDDTLTVRLLKYAELPEARHKAGMANFEKTEKDNGGYVAKNGFLYTFAAAQKAAPEGWRLPTDEDWKKLERTLGLPAAEADLNEAWRGEGLATLLSVGGKSGFNALRTGGNLYQREAGNFFENKDKAWYFWTATSIMLQDSIPAAYVRLSDHFTTKVWRGTSRVANNYRPVLYSVRCVKDLK